MPYEIKRKGKGYKVCKNDEDKCFSKKPLSKKTAEAQRRAIYASENKRSPRGHLNMVAYNYENNKSKTEEETINSEEMKAVLNPKSFEEFYMGKEKNKGITYDIFLKIFEKEYNDEKGRKKDFEFFWNNYTYLDYINIESKIQNWYKDPEARL